MPRPSRAALASVPENARNGGNALGKVGHAALDVQKKSNLALDVAVNKNTQNEDGSYELRDQG